MNMKIIIGILILFLFIGVAVMFAVPPAPAEPATDPAEPTPAPPAPETKTFENEYIIFQYPGDWIFIEETEIDNGNFSVIFHTPEGDANVSVCLRERGVTVSGPIQIKPVTYKVLDTTRFK